VVPRRVGPYRLERLLGRGGFGEVWRARGPSGRVALKLILPALRESEVVVERFRLEGEILTALEHPGLPRAREVGSADGELYIAMEYLEGETLDVELARRLRAGDPFSRTEALRVFGRITAAVAYAHDAGIVHRDLKPANVLRTTKGAIKVLDFGVARLVGATAMSDTTIGRTLGTVFYLSPEQIEGEPVDRRADVFALGCILFELLTLRRAWARDEDDLPLAVDRAPGSLQPQNHTVAVARRITGGRRPSPRALDASWPEAVDAVLARALAIEPDDRFADANAFYAAFEAALGEADPLAS